MTTWFVSRHPGAVAWAQAQGFAVDQLVPHLNPNDVQPGDVVMGTLPVNLAAIICTKGAAYWHLSLDLPADWRGQELSATQLTQLGAQLQRYQITPA
jgi:CRISPR-associated protein Csx16